MHEQLPYNIELSIVTTLYHSALYLEEFYNRMRTAAEKITSNYEIIFVNDGSPDNSLQVALSICEKDNNVKIIDLSRNFQHHKAIMTGLSYAKGNIIFIINCDLEEAPESIELFYQKFFEEPGCDLLYGVYDKRKGSFLSRVLGNIFYRIMNFLSDLQLNSRLASARMMSRRYVDNLLQFKENEVFFAGLLSITGFKQVPLQISSQYKGSTTYSLSRRISVSINAITSFSNKPLVYIFYSGSLIFFASGIFALDIIFKKIVYGIQIFGWASLIVSIWLIGGLIILFLGIIGIYISKIFIETKRRPYTVIRNIYDKQ